MQVVSWTPIPGGICLYGDRGRRCPVSSLAWTTTPVTWSQCGRNPPPGICPTAPVTCLTFQEASDLAVAIGGRLPMSVEWEWMATGLSQRRYPWGDEDWIPERANLRSSRYGQPTPVDLHLAGMTPDGLLDVAGNVWEWTATQVVGHGSIIRGGSYNSLPLYARGKFINAAPHELASGGIGVRVVRDL
ncbi:MAG: formylglycine-generating enzyme family protein [Pseudonocardiales bacterium]